MKKPAELPFSVASDQPYIERCLPAHMMYLMAEEVKKNGWEFRADMQRNLNVASIVPLKGLQPFDIQRLAKKTDEAARSLLHDLSPDDARHGLMTCAMFCLKLVDEGLFPDPRDMSVLVSLTLVEEAKTDHGEWRVDQTRATNEAKRLLTRAQLLGYYPKVLNKVLPFTAQH